MTVKEEIWKCDPSERAAMLTMSLVELSPRDTRAIIKGFLAVVEQMAACLQTTKAYGAIACDMRDAADRIERLDRDLS